MHFSYYLSLEKLRLQRYQSELEERISLSPPGEIHFHQNGTTDKWRIRENNQWRYLPKSERELARQLVQKDNWQKELALTKERISLLDELIDSYTQPVPTQPGSYDLLLQESNRTGAFAMLEWQKSLFASSNDRPEYKTVQTKAGVSVRSKSESIIADVLFQFGVPFHYEEELRLGQNVFYPDFTIRCPSNPDKQLIWEHFGMMSNTAYAQSAKNKISTYIDYGYIPMVNLIVTFETRDNPLDVNLVTLLTEFFAL